MLLSGGWNMFGIAKLSFLESSPVWDAGTKYIQIEVLLEWFWGTVSWGIQVCLGINFVFNHNRWFAQRGMLLYAHDFAPPLGFRFVQSCKQKSPFLVVTSLQDLIFNRGCVFIFLSLLCSLVFAGEVKRHNVCKQSRFLDTGCKPVAVLELLIKTCKCHFEQYRSNCSIYPNSCAILKFLRHFTLGSL